MPYAPERLANDRLFVIDLPGIAELLPMTTSSTFIIRTVRFLPLRRRLKDFNDACGRIILFLLDDLDVNNIVGRSSRYKHDALIRARETSAAVYNFFDFETH